MKVWESGAILLYLQKYYDKENKFGPATIQEEVDILSYLFLQVSGVGYISSVIRCLRWMVEILFILFINCTRSPTHGQVNWWLRYSKEKSPAAVERYYNEAIRLYNVLEARLNGRHFIASNHFTICEAAYYPWVCPFFI
jgi:glutathione S-transferase